jgi:hypothetical protein
MVNLPEACNRSLLFAILFNSVGFHATKTKLFAFGMFWLWLKHDFMEATVSVYRQ